MAFEFGVGMGLASLIASIISLALSLRIYVSLVQRPAVRTRLRRQIGSFRASFIANSNGIRVVDQGVVWLDKLGVPQAGDPLWPVENPAFPLQEVLFVIRGEANLHSNAEHPIVETKAGSTVVAWFTTETENEGRHSTALVWEPQSGRLARPALYEGERSQAWIPDLTGESVSLPRSVERRSLREMFSHLQRGRRGIPELTASRYDRIEIEGLRGFGPPESIALAKPNGTQGSGITILVGANNSGKSTVIEAFDAVFRATKQNSVSFGSDRRHTAGRDFVSIHLIAEDGRSVGVESLRAGTSETTVSWNKSASKEPTVTLDLTAIPARRQFSAYFGRMGDGQRGWASTSGEYSRSQNRDGFVGRLFALHADGARLTRFNKLFTEVTGRDVSWSIDLGAQNQYFLRFTEKDGSSHTSDGLGDGLISLLFILDSLHDSTPDSLIVIDEPELSLHPQYVVRLGSVLSRYAADRQIVFATHSPNLINWEWIASGAQVARIYKTDGQSKVAQPRHETLEKIATTHLTNRFNPHVFGPAGNEVFFQEDGLLVLEGQEDVLYLPTVLQSLEIDFQANVFGWGAGGAGKIAGLLELFRELHFRRVAVLLDGDVGTRGIVRNLTADFPEYAIESHPAEDIRTKPSSKAQVERVGLLSPDNKTVRSEYLIGAQKAIRGLVDYLTSA